MTSATNNSHGRDHGSARTMQDASMNAMDSLGQATERVVASVKPKLRGWIHAGTAPLALAAGIVLIALSPPGARWATAVFAASTVVLFGCSAVYHRGTWSPTTEAVLRRLDHSNIFLLIAGTYTPLAWTLLPRGTAILLLSLVWGGALGGILMRVLWLSAPRWLYVPLYVILGWVAVWFLPAFWRTGGPAIVWLVAAGGIAYTIGAAIYGFKRPNPSPKYFGFHEIFHVCTVIGYVCHIVAVFLAIYS